MAVTSPPPDPTSPASISEASFNTTRKGFDQEEVRRFLRRVSEEVTRLQNNVRWLEEELSAAKETVVVSPDELDEATLTRLLGEETARILQAARESATQIRERAEQGAASVLDDATNEAARMREAAELESAQRRTDAATEAEAEVEAAKEQGRQMVNEARSYRERVLGELTRRRDLAVKQIEQLVTDRDRLLGTFIEARDVAAEIIGALEPLEQPDEIVDLEPTTGPTPITDVETATSPTETLDTEPDRSADAADHADGDAAAADAGVESDGSPPAPAAGATGPGWFGDGDDEDDDSARITSAAFGELAGDVPRPSATSATAPVVSLFPSAGAADAAPDAADTSGTDAGETAGSQADAVGDETELADTPAGDGADETSEMTAGDAVADEAPELPDAGDGVDDDETTEMTVGDAVADETSEPAGAGVTDAGDDDPSPTSATTKATDDETKATQVDDLFARLRASSPTAEPPNGTSAAGHEATPADAVDDGSAPTITAETETETEAAEIATDDGSDDADDPDAEGSPTPFQARDAALGPSVAQAARRLKRVLADEQNELLDTLRQSASIRTLDALATPESSQTDRYLDAIADELEAAVNAGAASVPGDAAPQLDVSHSGALGPVRDTVTSGLIEPLRERLARCIDEADGDNELIVKRVRSIYREWKTHQIDDELDEVFRLAYGRGVYAALPEGSPVRWIVDPDGPDCPDAEDNSLAGEVSAGEPFPTGHVCAPAHEGCRCMLAPVLP